MINLLPPARLTNLRLARSNTILRRYLELVVVSIAALALFMVGLLYWLRQDQRSTQQVLDIESTQAAKLEPYQKQAEELSLTVNTIAGLLSNDVKFSDMLTQIGKLMPSGTSLSGLQLSVDNLKAPLVISAQVDSEDKAAVLRNNLVSSALFSRADIQSIKAIDKDVAPTTPLTPSSTAQTPIGNYSYTVVINAYLKSQTGAKQ